MIDVARVISVGRDRATGRVHLRFRDERGRVLLSGPTGVETSDLGESWTLFAGKGRSFSAFELSAT